MFSAARREEHDRPDVRVDLRGAREAGTSASPLLSTRRPRWLPDPERAGDGEVATCPPLGEREIAVVS
ncbi:MAG: hypothetical protein IPN77_24720 [Sandaracinaceae bacterium]|nr:hypothetical protein [Sandaracinaceae bacterium]